MNSQFSAQQTCGDLAFDAESVEQRTLNGRDYLVAPGVLVREQVLNGGFLPNEEIEASVQAWNGVPVTLDHPMKGGTLVPANRLDVYDEGGVIGRVFGAEHSPKERALKGDVWLDIEATRELGEMGEAVLAALSSYSAEADEPDGETPILDVSVGYWHNEEPTEGTFNGESFEEIARDVLPDHLAILPHMPGRCPVEGGCGMPRESASDPAEPAYRPPLADDAMPADVAAAYASNALDQARTPTYSGTSSSEWSTPALDDYVSGLDLSGDTWDDLSSTDRQAVVDRTLLGDPSADTFGDAQVFPVVEPSSDALNENALDAVIGGRGAQADVTEDQLESARRVAYSLLNDEFDRDVEYDGEAGTGASTEHGDTNVNSLQHPDPDEPLPDDPDERRNIVAQAFATMAAYLGSGDDPEGEGGSPDGQAFTAGGSGSGDCGCDGAGDECTCDDHDSLTIQQDNGATVRGLTAQQQESDRVRWDSENGASNEPNDVRYGIVVNELPDGPEEEVLVAVYGIEDGGWENLQTEEQINRERLEVIEQFPPVSNVTTNSDPNADTDTTMNIEELAAQSGYTEDELREMDDDQRQVVEKAIDVNADDDPDDGGDGDADADADADGDDPSGDGDPSGIDGLSDPDGDGGQTAADLFREAAEEDPDATRDVLADLGVVTEDDPTIAQASANRMEQRRQHKKTIRAQSDVSEDALDAMDDGDLAELAASVGGEPYAANAGGRTGVNYAGQSGPSPSSDDGEEDDDYRPEGVFTASGGD